ncbi:DELTA-thalatoxin-Avl1a-like [Alosa sapidissima]|uniref:DELTA-thalatoxin-Avl1a-like n=1 Tax=Alosa sapidissima TaxID=34773 RepID=UPI001C0836C3|nr:DELTA-thalatoxin-Avl1a-like [Alosa sapidissima]
MARQCSVNIENTSMFTLCNVMSYSNSGFCDVPLPPRLSPSENGSAVYRKTPNTARGAVAVFTYDICWKCEDQAIEKIAVMFSNPYDFASGSNWYAVGVFRKETVCDYALYNEMYNKVQNRFVRGKASQGSLTYSGSSVTISANMSDSYKPVLKVNVYNK